MTYGVIRSVLVTAMLSGLAYAIGVFDYATFLGTVIVGILVFVSGYITGNQPGWWGALVTGFVAVVRDHEDRLARVYQRLKPFELR